MDAAIVIGWDGSISARRALRWAQGQNSTSILLVQVVRETVLLDGLDPRRVEPPEDDISIETAAEETREFDENVTVETRIIVGDPVAELARFTGPGTVLAVGDRHRSVLRFRAGWSVGARLAAFATGPVAIIANEYEESQTGVVVGVDDSDGAHSALIFAAAHAAKMSQTLHVVHAWHSSSLWRDRAMPPAPSLAEANAQHTDVLTAAVNEARRRHPELLVVGSVVDEAPGQALLRASAGCSLLVIGDGRATSIERMLLGTASYDILLNLDAPTVIIPRPAPHSTALTPAASALPNDDMTGLSPRSTPTQPPVHVVVGWDGSPPSRAALEWAVAREKSGPTPGHVDVVMVADEPLADTDSEITATTIAFDERAVQRLINDVSDSAPDVAIRGKVVHGFVLHALSELSQPDTLMVIGTEDRKGPRLRFDYSVGAHLPALAHGPVTIVPSTIDPSLTGVAVGVDGFDPSNDAVLTAAAEAARRGETLHLVHAWTKPVLHDTLSTLDSAFVSDLEGEHRSILDAASNLAAAHFPTVQMKSHLVRGHAARALLDLSPSPAIIVVGNRGLSGWQRFRLGSVSHELVLNTRVPLFIIGRPDAPQQPQHLSSPDLAAALSVGMPT
ncbi:universal stress protein [Microbacterium hatanonis]|uniref:UspA domain-containing protein n=1 Tax=Microbacterium hatanonis TaxID=404366 RepID=A0A5C8I0E5_9MICO|nr:universal stress protein [Microbacterium hatanonis]TXK12336.1 hypothetical protein FVP77_02320 [Microbacterium hatanonis]